MTMIKAVIRMHTFYKDVSGTKSLVLWLKNRKATTTTTKAEIQTAMFHKAVVRTRSPIKFMDGVCICVEVPGRTEVTKRDRRKCGEGREKQSQHGCVDAEDVLTGGCPVRNPYVASLLSLP